MLATTAEQELRERREALAAAVSAHDLEAVKTFIDPSLVVRAINWVGNGQVALTYDQLMAMVEQSFRRHPDYRETVEIEAVAVEGDTAQLTVRRRVSRKMFGFLPWHGMIRQQESWEQRGGRWVVVQVTMPGVPEGAPAPSSPERRRAERWQTWLNLAGLVVIAAVWYLGDDREWRWTFPAIMFILAGHQLGHYALAEAGSAARRACLGVAGISLLVGIGALFLLWIVPPGGGR